MGKSMDQMPVHWILEGLYLFFLSVFSGRPWGWDLGEICLDKHLYDGGGGVFSPWGFITTHIWASKIYIILYDISVRNGFSRSTSQADMLRSTFECNAPGRSTRKSQRFTILFSWRVIGRCATSFPTCPAPAAAPTAPYDAVGSDIKPLRLWVKKLWCLLIL